MDTITIKLPPHKAALHLVINNHQSNDQTVKEYLEQDAEEGGRIDLVGDDDAFKAALLDRIIELQWYPHTPNGFNCIGSSSVEDINIWLVSEYGPDLPEVTFALPDGGCYVNIVHNLHKSYYETVAERYGEKGWVSEEQRLASVAADDVWSYYSGEDGGWLAYTPAAINAAIRAAKGGRHGAS